jgi:chemotaxis protein histidine kinase CheA
MLDCFRYKPLEGTAEHVSTLDSLCMWVKTHAEARAAQAARREEMRRRQEEERRRLEADPVWQEQQREAARRRKQAEEEAAANCAEQQRIAAEQRRIAEEQWRIAEEQAAQAKRAAWEAKARLLAAKVQSGPGTCDAPGSSAAQQEEQVPVAASGSEQANIEQPSELAIQLASCQECKDHMQFCSDKDCVILILDSCKCRESIMHAALTEWVRLCQGFWYWMQLFDWRLCSTAVLSLASWLQSLADVYCI